MPRYGAYNLGEVRAARVVIECATCDRRGDYSTQRLLQQYGPDIGMPDLKSRLVSCPNRMHDPNQPCQAFYSKETRLSWT